MITNKDIRVENGSLILNGDPYPLDGQSPEAIMEIVEDNSDSTPTENSTKPVKSGGIYSKIGDLTQTGLTGDSVAAQLDTAREQIANLLITDTFTTTPKDYTAGTDGYCSVSGVSKSGYTMLGIIDIDANKTGFGLTTWNCTPGAVTAWIRPLVNITGLTMSFKILYIKDLS